MANVRAKQLAWLHTPRLGPGSGLVVMMATAAAEAAIVAAVAIALERGGSACEDDARIHGGCLSADLVVEPISGALTQISNLWPGTAGAQLVKLCQQIITE